MTNPAPLVDARPALRSPPADPRPALAPPLDLGRPIRMSVFSNRQSGRNLHDERYAALQHALRSFPEVAHHEIDHGPDVVSAANALAREEPELIVINGGDGTVQAVLTALLGGGPMRRLPLLAVLPQGTTNMIAADIGSRLAPSELLQRLLRASRTGRLDAGLVRRRVMRVEVAPERTVYGMFFGAGAIYHGIHFCRKRVHALGVKGELGPGLALGIFLTQLLLGRAGATSPPLRARMLIDGDAFGDQLYFGMMVSTLKRLFLGLRPFWATGPGALRLSAVEHAPRHLLRAAPAIMRGRPNRFVRPDLGYVSHNARDIRLELDSGFTLDGELFESSEWDVTLGAGPEAFFLRLSR